MVKRVEKAHGLQKLKVPKVKKGNPVLKRKYTMQFIPQEKIKTMYNEVREPKISSDLQTISLARQAASTKIGKVIKGHLARKDTRNEIINLASNEKAAATLQSAVRRKTDMMKKRQLVDEEQLKQMEETRRQIESAKADKAKKEDIAAKQLQAVSKRLKAQSEVSKIKQAKDKIGAAAKRLLTEKVKSAYIPKAKTTMIWNKNTVGQPLVVNKKLQLVSKKRHNAGVEGYETRQVYLDLAKQYKDVMTKGQKKK